MSVTFLVPGAWNNKKEENSVAATGKVAVAGSSFKTYEMETLVSSRTHTSLS